MGQTDQSFGEHRESDSQRIPIPMYDPSDQVRIFDPHQTANYGIPELYAIARAHRILTQDLARQTHIPNALVNGQGLDWAIDHTDRDVAQHFDAHGITKGDPVALLKNLLTDGIKPPGLYTMPFVREIGAAGAFGAETPFTDGGVIVTSGYNQHLNKDGIKYVFIGEGYIQGVDLFQKVFPHVQFVPWHDAPRVLTEEASQQIGQTLPYETATEENRPYYRSPRIGVDPHAENHIGVDKVPTLTPSDDDSLPDRW